MKRLLAALLLSLTGCTQDVPATAQWRIDLFQPGYDRAIYFSAEKPEIQGAFVDFIDVRSGQELHLSGTVQVQRIARP